MEINPAMMGRPMAAPGQNLINHDNIPIGRPAGFWKSVILDLLSLLGALALGYSYLFYLTVHLSPWYVLAAGLVFSVCSVLEVFLPPRAMRRNIVIAGEAIVLVVPFLFYDPWPILILTAVVVYLGLLWGHWSGHAYAHNTLEVAFFGTSARVLGKLTSAALLLMILLYAPQAQGSGIFLPRNSFRTFFAWSAGFFNGFYPSLPLSDSIGSFAQELARMELQNNPTFAALSPNAQSTTVQEAANQFLATASSATGSKVLPAESVADVSYNYIVALLSSWKDRFQDQFLLAWGIVVFMVLRAIGVVYVWLAQFVSLIIYELLLATGFMHVSEATQTKEVVEY